MQSHNGLFGILLLSGFLGSLGHCLGMCGPLVIMLSIQIKNQGLPTKLSHFLFHFSRIIVYAILGAVIGGIGSLLGLGSQINVVAGITSAILGILVMAFGMGYLGLLSFLNFDSPAQWFGRAFKKAIKSGGISGIIILGALNGILPCGLVYSALLLSANGGGVIQGMFGMFLFGLGTIPALIFVGLSAGAISARFRQTLNRMAGILMLIAGLQLILRGLAALRILPHLQIGAIILW